ncbi:MAG: ATP-binding cassette domain-containing protein [SAR202 cluster bacterium]|nr:ATP-binding cassette domain-containing protein [SAR202 cluster bacterium]
MPLNETGNLVDVKNLVKYFPVRKGIVIQRHVADVKAVDDVSFFIRPGETLGMVGESGCGKTTVARTMLQLYRPTSGTVEFQGQDLATLKGRALRDARREMQMIFQDPYGSLNPRMNCGNIIGEPLIVHKLTRSRNEYRDQVAELLTTVGLAPYMASRFPHEFSGGQRQRIGVARALAVRPSFIACDEPVSALDVSIQAQLINLLEELQAQFQLTYLFVAHDLSVVRHISDRIVVMYLGKIAEIATRDELYANPLHPYTQALLSAVPIPDPVIEATRSRILLTGDVPSPLRPPPGCVFNPRCQSVGDDCAGTHTEGLTNEAGVPDLREVSPDHWVSCIKV